MWTPEREDLLLELCGEIEDEDTTLIERAEARAERFEDTAKSVSGKRPTHVKRLSRSWKHSVWSANPCWASQ